MRDSQCRVIGSSKIARDITERKQTEAALKQAELSASLLQVQDEERRRIARELHDGVGQLLAAISMNISQVVKEKPNLSPAAAQRLEESSNLVGQALAEIRTVSYLLHPPLLDEMGLPSALRWYIDGFAERSKIAANMELSVDLGRLPQDYELCLFRIAQECLTNIHRHSGSATARVRLWRTPGKIKMEVSDQGRGINQEIQTKIAMGKGAGGGSARNAGKSEANRRYGGNSFQRERRIRSRGTAAHRGSYSPRNEARYSVI